MKNRVAFSFIMGIVIMTLIITILNVLGIGGFILFEGAFKSESKYNLGLSSFENTMVGPEEYVADFKKYIDIEGDIFLKQEALESLDINNSWIQILDENGLEVYNYKKPKEVIDNYTPFDMVDYYKYDKPSNVFVNKLEKDDLSYTYLIGIPRKLVSKKVIIYNNEQLKYILTGIILVIIIIDIILAGVFGFYFSRKVADPLDLIIERIELLSNGVYKLEDSSNILYDDVHWNLNDLSIRIEENEKNREKLDRMKEQWIVNISHDIKTPLSSIEGYSELLMGSYDLSNDEIVSYGKIINSKSRYMEELIDEISLSTKLKNDDIILKLEKVNIVSYIRNLVIEILNTEDYNIINIEFIPESEDIEVEIDKLMFKRVFNNIIYNSIYYSNEDLIIEVGLYRSKNDIIIEIKDNGIGIDEKDMENIFNRYYRGTNTNKKGTGLGLAIAKDIIEYHGASISVQSEVNKFTKFIIKI